MSGHVATGWSMAVLLAVLAGCSGSGTPTPQARDEEQVRQAFANLQQALKARDPDKLWSLLDEDRQADADRAARAVREAFARGDAAKHGEQEKELGLPTAQLKHLKGPGYLKTTRFIGKHDEVPDSKVDKVVVQGDRATVHFTEPDGDKEKLTLVRQKGEWKFSDVKIPQPSQP